MLQIWLFFFYRLTSHWNFSKVCLCQYFFKRKVLTFQSHYQIHSLLSWWATIICSDLDSLITVLYPFNYILQVATSISFALCSKHVRTTDDQGFSYQVIQTKTIPAKKDCLDILFNFNYFFILKIIKMSHIFKTQFWISKLNMTFSGVFTYFMLKA